MTYDFDTFSVVPQDFRTRYAGLLARFDIAEQAEQQVSMFRDPAALKALAGAAEEIQQCFVASGFTLECTKSKAPFAGSAERDHAARADVLKRLRTALAGVPDGADWNGFERDAFLAMADAGTESEAETPAFKTRRVADAAKAIRVRVQSRPLSTPAPSF